jgi:hypothetical protein
MCSQNIKNPATADKMVRAPYAMAPVVLNLMQKPFVKVACHEEGDRGKAWGVKM